MASERRATRLIIPVPATDDAWELEDDVIMPESTLHDLAVDLLAQVLRAWIDRTKRNARAARNLAVRWDEEHPGRGVDPDVCLLEPDPPEGEALTSVRLWRPGHEPPRVSIEVVSDRTPEKDYVDGPARHAASGTRELWVFDPLRLGPRPFVLQLWRRTARGAFRRVYAGDGPAFSRELAAWLVVTDEGRRLRIADDRAGTRCWPTHTELAEQARVEAERARVEAERARVEAEQGLAAAERARVEAEQARDRERTERATLEARLAALEAERAAGAVSTKRPRGRR